MCKYYYAAREARRAKNCYFEKSKRILEKKNIFSKKKRKKIEKKLISKTAFLQGFST
jgi:hypothetical protein